MPLEFDLIEQFFKPLSFSLPGEIGIGDDGAVLQCPENHQLVVVTDTLISGVHFPKNTTPFNIAWKALAVNLSDLAAMGAKPAFYSLALTLPDELNKPEWLEGFSKGLDALASKFNIPLVGGDTTRGFLSITITAQGWVEANSALLRSNARVGDDIYVSGSLGEAGLGLVNILGNINKSDEKFSQFAEDKLSRPEPRVSLGRALLVQQLSTCAIDISDGFLQDLRHVLKASNLSGEVYMDKLPISAMVKDQMQQNILFAMTAGDDYELCFTVSTEKSQQLQVLAEKLNLPLTLVGKILDAKEATEDNLVLLNSQGEKILIDFKKLGYQHF